MSVENTVASLNGLFKEIYAEKIKDLIPDGVVLVNMIGFVGKDRTLGNLYHQPVILGQEHGFSYGGTDGTAFALSDSTAGQVKDAQVQGYEFLLRTKIAYGAVSRSVGSKAAFENATKLIVANMLKSFAKRIEAILFYGQAGLGTVSAHASGVITVTTAEWAPGLWSGGVNMLIELYNETTLAQIAVCQVSKVLLESRQLELLGADDPLSAGEQTALNTALGSSQVVRLYHKGARGNEFAGLHRIMTNTGSLFNINAGVFDLWRSIEHTCSSAALSFAKIQAAVAKAVEKGLDSDLVCLVNPRAWSDLMGDEAALRVYDKSYSGAKAENGMQSIMFYSQNGKIEIKPCNYVKEGFAYMFPPEELMRVGSTDITFKRPGSGDDFFRELDNSAGYELRAYSDQALFCNTPARLILLKDVVNGA